MQGIQISVPRRKKSNNPEQFWERPNDSRSEFNECTAGKSEEKEHYKKGENMDLEEATECSVIFLKKSDGSQFKT